MINKKYSLREGELVATRMASSGEIVNIYVKALFSLSVERDQIEVTAFDLKKLEGRLREKRNILNRLKSPVFSKKEQMASLSPLIKDLSPLVQNFVGILNKYRRLNFLLPMIWAYGRRVQEHFGFLTVEGESAFPMRVGQKQALLKKLKGQTGKEVILNFKENSNLLGGFWVQIQSTLIDCSLKTKISFLQTQKGSL